MKLENAAVDSSIKMLMRSVLQEQKILCVQAAGFVISHVVDGSALISTCGSRLQQMLRHTVPSWSATRMKSKAGPASPEAALQLSGGDPDAA